MDFTKEDETMLRKMLDERLNAEKMAQAKNDSKTEVEALVKASQAQVRAIQDKLSADVSAVIAGKVK